MTKFKLFLISFYLIIPSILFSQEHTINKVLKKKAIEYKNEINFNKAQYFFLKQDWDSTLIYSMKQLRSNTNREIADYCHFFRGYSFIEIKLFKNVVSRY